MSSTTQLSFLSSYFLNLYTMPAQRSQTAPVRFPSGFSLGDISDWRKNVAVATEHITIKEESEGSNSDSGPDFRAILKEVCLFREEVSSSSNSCCNQRLIEF